jgi:hypothetical protein
MAHFAKLSDDNVVLGVEHLNDEDVQDENGNEVESVGVAHQVSVHGWPHWKQCSYRTNQGKHWIWDDAANNWIENPDQSGSFRKNYPHIGDTYDSTRNAFIRKRQEGMNSWVLNEDTCHYEPPVAKPESQDDVYYSPFWVEALTRWERAPKTIQDENGNDVTNEDHVCTQYWNTSSNSWVDK